MYGNDTAALYEALDHPSFRLVKPLPKRGRIQVPRVTISSPPPSTDKDTDKLGSLGSEPHITPRALTAITSPSNISKPLEISDQPDAGAGLTLGQSTAVLGLDGVDVIDWSEPHFHLNKKKRKTPNIGGRGMLEELGDDHPSEIDGGARSLLELDNSGQTAYQIVPTWNRDRLSQVTRAGMRQKELNIERKRIVSAAFDGDENYDPADVEQALSSGFLKSRTNPVRIYRTKKSLSRAILPSNEVPGNVPQASFDFHFPSATSERSVKQGQRVSQLHARFRDELDRLDLVLVKTVPAPPVKPSKSSRSRGVVDPATTTISDTSSGLPAEGKKKKKKKRSALANASNPHHLRNYVPSRLPNSGPTNPTDAAQNLLSPLPVRFLNANLPPSDTAAPRTKDARKTPTSVPEPPSLTDPSDEWICPFCEYNLFYGDERAFQRALRSRKKVLRRRRRARERAAAAANGKPLPTKAAGAGGHAAGGDEDEDEDALFEPPHDDVPASITSQMKWKSVKDMDTRTRAG